MKKFLALFAFMPLVITGQTTVYEIPLSQLINMTGNCGNGDYVNDNNASYGIEWTSTGGSTPNSVTVELNRAMDLDNTPRPIALNGINQGNISARFLYGCGTYQIETVSMAPADYNPGGINQVIITATNTHGFGPNISWNNAFARVTVVYGCSAPVADNANIDMTASCASAVTVPFPTASSSCYGTISGTTSDQTIFNSPGVYTINWTYDDGNGNSSTQVQNVIIEDSDAPVPDESNLAVVSGECSVTVSQAPTATDDCAGTITGTTNDPLIYNNVGTYTISWTYDDGNGNISTQTQYVIVEDSNAPIPDLNMLPDITGACAVSVTSAPTATDACKGSITGTTTDPLTYGAQGSYTITWTYDDGNGNISSQVQNIVIEDTDPPIANQNTLADVTGECSVTVTSVPSATDNCAGQVSATTTDPLTYNVVGSYFITWTYDDGNGNSSNQIQNVIVSTIDTSVVLNNFTLTANKTGADYKWFDCKNKSLVPNETGQSFSPGVNGEYALIISQNNGTDTSSCYLVEPVGIAGKKMEGEIKVYPNPVGGNKLNIDFPGNSPGRAVLTNFTGQFLIERKITGSNLSLDLSGFESGIYFLHIELENSERKVIKLVKN